jgi:hypothetical protein
MGIIDLHEMAAFPCTTYLYFAEPATTFCESCMSLFRHCAERDRKKTPLVVGGHANVSKFDKVKDAGLARDGRKATPSPAA